MSRKHRVYITKYWKKKGIIIENADIIQSIHSPNDVLAFIPEKMNRAIVRTGRNQGTYYGNDFWLTKEEAVAFIRDSLRKQISSAEAKVKKLKVMQKRVDCRIVDARKGKA